jgi:hypothetical protein
MELTIKLGDEKLHGFRKFKIFCYALLVFIPQLLTGKAHLHYAKDDNKGCENYYDE